MVAFFRSVCGVIMTDFPAWIPTRGLGQPRHPNQTRLQKILNACQVWLAHVVAWASAVSQLGQSINTYWLHDWIPWAPKTSSINHASTFQAAVPLQLSALPSKNEKGGEICAERLRVFAGLCGCCWWWWWWGWSKDTTPSSVLTPICSNYNSDTGWSLKSRS